MKDRKTTIQSLAILAIVFVVYNVLAFVIPFEKTGTFWLSYIFSVIAIAVQVYVIKVAFCKEKSVKSKFYGFPVANVGVIYMLAQLALSLVFMALAARVVSLKAFATVFMASSPQKCPKPSFISFKPFMSITITVIRERLALGLLNFFKRSSYALRFCTSVIESVYASSNNFSVILFFIVSSLEKFGGGS